MTLYRAPTTARGVRYHDFCPAVRERGGLTVAPTFESLEDIVEQVNEWIRETGAEVLNVETLLIPAPRLDQDVSLESAWFAAEKETYWFQAVRVWFRAEAPEPPDGRR